MLDVSFCGFGDSTIDMSKRIIGHSGRVVGMDCCDSVPRLFARKDATASA